MFFASVGGPPVRCQTSECVRVALALPCRLAAIVDREPPELIHDLLERSPGSPYFRFELGGGGDVIVEGES
ncbi:MAG: hypothetical protein LUP91_12615, partial [Methylococcaceae bacterium]|nr:hypothetical protein [Methylococcaceae bacterium]